MRLVLSLFAFAALAACETAVPTDGLPTVSTAKNSVAESVSKTDTTTVIATAKATEPAAEKTDTVALGTDHPTISDTQNFGAVTAKLSIEDDKARLKAQRQEFKVIKPTALPKRVKTVSVVEFALSTTNKVGEKIYSRFNPLGKVLSPRDCAKFSSSDEAQLVFLRSGGPRRDPKSLDPDGDGFACDWTPETYRKLVKK